MAYASDTSMIGRFGEDQILALTDPDGTGAINTAVLDQALADASATIDGYLVSRYDLPLTTVPPMLEPLCCDIARYKLATAGNSMRPTDQMRERYEDALAWLTKVASGTIGLGVDTAGQTPVEAGGSTGVNFVPGRSRVFDSGSLGDFSFQRGRGPNW